MFQNNKSNEIKKKRKESLILKGFIAAVNNLFGLEILQFGVVFTKIDIKSKGSNVLIYMYCQEGQDRGVGIIKKIMSYEKQIQSDLNSVLKFKYAVKISIVYDTKYDKILKINNLLKKIRDSNE